MDQSIANFTMNIKLNGFALCILFVVFSIFVESKTRAFLSDDKSEFKFANEKI